MLTYTGNYVLRINSLASAVKIRFLVWPPKKMPLLHYTMRFVKHLERIKNRLIKFSDQKPITLNMKYFRSD